LLEPAFSHTRLLCYLLEPAFSHTRLLCYLLEPAFSHTRLLCYCLEPALSTATLLPVAASMSTATQLTVTARMSTATLLPVTDHLTLPSHPDPSLCFSHCESCQLQFGVLYQKGKHSSWIHALRPCRAAGAARQSGENVELLNSWLKLYYKIARSLSRNRFHKMIFMLRHQHNLDRCPPRLSSPSCPCETIVPLVLMIAIFKVLSN
jgi:hypothetical protein